MGHRLRSALRLALLTAALAGAGCYGSRSISWTELESLREPVVCRIRYLDQGRPRALRALVTPDLIAADGLECRPCAYQGSSWRIRFSGWPAVYRSGKYWRPETAGGTIEIARASVEDLRLERLDWPLTILGAPLTLPAGLVDFLVDNVEIGFDAVNDRFDAFSRPPETGLDAQRQR
jgi:hypothetical protein